MLEPKKPGEGEEPPEPSPLKDGSKQVDSNDMRIDDAGEDTEAQPEA